jgi:hypothetical protein
MKKNLRYYKYTDGGYEEEPESGHLAYAERQGADGVHRTSEWYFCRESFHIHFNDHNKRPKQFLLFVDDNGEAVERFIKKAEKRLHVDVPTEILGFKNCRNVVCVRFSPWWKQNEARWQLFTILLRCGLDYHGHFNNALWNSADGYTEQTREAVERFFDGYTHFTTDGMTGGEGWVYWFSKDEFEQNDFESDFDSYDDGYDEDLEKQWNKRLALLKKPKGK